MARRQSVPVTRSRWVVEVNPKVLVPSLERLREHLQGYLPLFASRSEVRDNAKLVLEGLLSNLERKSVEPIAEFHGKPRRDLQRFVGAGGWRGGGMGHSSTVSSRKSGRSWAARMAL